MRYFWIGLAAFLAVYFVVLYRDPPPESLVRFIQTVSQTRPSPPATSSKSDVTTAVDSAPLTKDAAGGSLESGEEPIAAHKRKKHSHFRPQQQGADPSRSGAKNHHRRKHEVGSPPPPVFESPEDAAVLLPSLATTRPVLHTMPPAQPFNEELVAHRFAVKQHVMNAWQLFVDYPISYWIATEAGLNLAAVPGITANLISCIHPIAAIAAGLLIWRSAKIPASSSSSSSEQPAGGQAMSPAAPLPGGAVVDFPANPDFVTERQGLMSTSAGTPCGNMERASSSILMTATPSVADFLSPTAEKHGAEAGSSKPAYDYAASLRSTVNLPMLRAGCFMYLFRNVLDVLDGVVARTQRRSAILQANTLRKDGGWTGHQIDVATDTLGCTVFGFSIFFFLVAKNVTISRVAVNLLNRVGVRLPAHRSVLIARIVACFGLLHIAFAAGLWEHFMLLYSNLIDVNIFFYPQLISVDECFGLRLNEFMWSWLSGDTYMFLLAMAGLFNRLWECVQLGFFAGIPLVTLTSLHSLYLWHFVILSNPTAAAIVAASAGVH